MIFVSVGTHPQQFNRLLEKVDELIEKGKIKEKVFAQIGVSDYKPKHFEFVPFVSLDEFQKLIKNCSVFITHGGEGSIGNGLQLNAKMIIVPRLKKFKEHTNNHQLELTRAMAEEKRALAVIEINELEKALEEIKSFKPKDFSKERKIISLIEEFCKEKGLI